MSGQPSALGFGYQLYGAQYNHFGWSDWAEPVSWGVFPIFVREQDLLGLGTVDLPLRKWVDALKPLLNELRFKWADFPNLWDANTCPLSNLPQLAHSVGLVDDASRSEEFRRSRILNVAQLCLNKGNDKGYEIVGSYDSLLVTITPLWASDCTAGATLSPTTTLDTWAATFDHFTSDEIPCDQEFSGPYDKWPNTLVPITEECRSSWFDLHFYAPGDVEIENFADVAPRVLEDLERVRPIHVRFNSVTFDGPKCAAGGWTIDVVADVSASAGGWSIPVTGALLAACGGWTLDVVATPTP